MTIAEELNAKMQSALGSDTWTRSNPVASDLDPQTCLRRQVLEIVNPSAKAPLEARVRERLQAGVEVEERVALRLGHLGMPVMRRGEHFILTRRGKPGRAATGKIDGVLRPNGQDIIIEIKLVPEWAFEDLRTPDDLFEMGWWTPKWVYQLLLYQLGLSIELGMHFVTDGRRSKFLEPQGLTPNLDRAEKAYAFAERICDAVDEYRAAEAAGKPVPLPPFTDSMDECLRCPFYGRACTPTLQARGEQPWVVLDEEFTRKVARRAALRDGRDEYETLDRELKETVRAAAPAEWSDATWNVPPATGKARHPKLSVMLQGGWYATLSRTFRRAEQAPRGASAGVKVDFAKLPGV